VIRLAAVVLIAVAATAADTIDSLERALAGDPENLRIAADYRQLAIAAKDFDRPIDFLEKLAKRKEAGPNVQISLALAYVDKVPTSGDIRRLYLGRDAINALTKSIEQRPSVLAYWARGRINLYYNNFIFKRIPRGIADLEKAITLITADTPPALIARVYQSLGDGQWRIEERAKAREAWKQGAARVPSDPSLSARVAANDEVAGNLVSGALYAPTRVDTSLRGIVP
jgi:hypothetical protein